MAKTQLADIIEPTIFMESMVERTQEKSRIWGSGMVGRSEEFDRLASGDGLQIPMPFWEDLTGPSEVLSDSSALTAAKMTQLQDNAHRHFRGRGWSANHVAKAVARSPLKDPLEVLVDLLADYWARSIQSDILVPTLTGIFATTLAASHTTDVAIEDGDAATSAELVGSNNVIDAAQKLGDSRNNLTAMVCHSKVASRLDKLNLIETVPLEGQNTSIRRFMDMEVIEDDGVRTVAGGTSGFKYSTYIFGPGAIAHGEGGPPSLDADEALEEDRDILAGDGTIVSRRHLIIHPRGVAFDPTAGGALAGPTPSTAELETGAKWTRVWEVKNIRVVQLITNG